jgi:hypothetical protein
MRSLFLASTSWLENSQRNNKCKNCIKMKNVNVHHKMKNVNLSLSIILTLLSMCGTKISQGMTPVHIYT